jgi:hypothetical protein
MKTLEFARRGATFSCTEEFNMRRPRAVTALIAASLLSACAAPVALAPGADKVQLTNDAGKVASCTPVGNIAVPNVASEDSFAELRNHTIGLGGNTVFITSTQYGTGVAYRCP